MKSFIKLIFLLLASQSCFPQNNILEQLRNGARCFRNDSLMDCVIYYDSVYNTSPFFFNSSISFIAHRALLNEHKAIKHKAIKCIKLYSEANLTSSDILKPIVSYLEIKSDTNRQELEKRCSNLLNGISISKDTSYYAALYSTAMYFELDRKLKLNDSIKQIWIEQLILQNNRTSASRFKEILSLKKYLEFTYINENYLLNQRKVEDVLNFYISPESITDLRYFFVIKEEFGFYSVDTIKEKIILDKLSRGENDELFFKQFAIFVASSPTEKNLLWLKESYSLPTKFEDFWYTNSQKTWDEFYDVPKVNAFIDSLRHKNQWIVLDVWGTWCSPCIKELPKFQVMSNKFREIEGKPIQFLSLSYSSENLSEFMNNNNYDFPVIEITKEETKKMNIRSYPITYLFAPNNKFISLPSFSDKEEIIKVFTLKEW